MSDHVIATELARLILGGRGPSRPELRMDLTGHLARIRVAYGLQLHDVGSQLVPVLRRMFQTLSRNLEEAPHVV